MCVVRLHKQAAAGVVRAALIVDDACMSAAFIFPRVGAILGLLVVVGMLARAAVWHRAWFGRRCRVAEHRDASALLTSQQQHKMGSHACAGQQQQQKKKQEDAALAGRGRRDQHVAAEFPLCTVLPGLGECEST